MLEENYINCRIVMIPTRTDPVRIQRDVDYGILGYHENKAQIIDGQDYEGIHLYFTSSEEIKLEDWRTCPHKGKGIDVGKGTPPQVCVISRGGNSCKDCRKIVASTNPSLNLPAIPQSFLQQYVESNGSIKSVRLEIYPDNRVGHYEKALDTKYNEYTESMLKLTSNNEVIVLPELERGITITKVVDEVDEALKSWKKDKDPEFFGNYEYQIDLAFEAGVAWRNEQIANESIEFADWFVQQDWSLSDKSTKELYELWKKSRIIQ